jgi:PIN domain nuclease of toxin-antitoxin system
LGRPLLTVGPYLLDTHAVIWHVTDSKRLSKNAESAIQKGEVALSVAVFWEVVIKSRKNLLDVSDPVAWWDRVVARLGAPVLSIRPAHVAVVAELAALHADPFDRIMIAQSISEGYTLITNDPLIKRYPVKTLW